jgi:hypothetical protein
MKIKKIANGFLVFLKDQYGETKIYQFPDLHAMFDFIRGKYEEPSTIESVDSIRARRGGPEWTCPVEGGMK